MPLVVGHDFNQSNYAQDTWTYFFTFRSFYLGVVPYMLNSNKDFIGWILHYANF